MKSSSISYHLKLQKHKKGKEQLKRKEAREKDLSIANKLNEETHVVGGNIIESTHLSG